MNRVGWRESVSELDVPQSDVGAPLPAVIASETSLDLIYLVSDPDPEWDGTYVNVRSVESEVDLVAVIQFEHAYAHTFGPPNDEAFHGHRLASRGVRPYSAWEVHRSSWIRALEHMNRVHPYHRSDQFTPYRHFIFAFHDTTFECVAHAFSAEVVPGSVSSIAAARVGSWA